MSERITKKTYCRMCGTLCGIDAHVENGKVVEIEGMKEHVANKGRICIKGSSAATWVNLPTRLTKPLKRTENGWEEIELEVAMDEIADKLKDIQNKYGKRSVGIWKGEGVGFAQQEELARRFIHAIGSPNYFSNDTQCYAGRYLGFNLVYGIWPVADYSNSKLIINWGTNAPVSHSYWMQQINEGRDKGAKLVVVDTKYTEIARQADLFVRIKPGTDAAFAWGVIRELIEKNILDEDFIKNYTVGFEKIKEYAQSFTKEFVQAETGVDPLTLDSLVSLIDNNRPYVSSWAGTGLEHQQNGVNNIRTITFIDALVGSIDRKGGMLCPEGFGGNELTLYHELPLLEEEPIGASTYPVLYQKRQECHTLMLMDQILSGKPYEFKGLILTAADPALTNANTNKVIEALKSLELLVVKDLFMTETAKLADYVIPAASYLEREELHYYPAKQCVFLSEKVVDNGMQNEYDLIKGLADRLGAGEYFPWENEHELNKWLVEPTGFSLDEIKEKRGGFEYKPCRYLKHEEKLAKGEKCFNTPTGKIEFYSQYLVDLGFDGIPVYHRPAYIAEPSEEYPYLLMTGARKQLYFHGRYRNIPQLKKACPNGEIEMNPVDAEKLNVVTGDIVKVTSKNGSIEIPVKVLNEKEIVEGAFQITHGFIEANVNILTDDDMRDPISGFPALKSVCVKVEKK